MPSGRATSGSSWIWPASTTSRARVFGQLLRRPTGVSTATACLCCAASANRFRLPSNWLVWPHRFPWNPRETSPWPGSTRARLGASVTADSAGLFGGDMAAPSWNISGQYFETCSCDFVCPCILGQMAVRPSKGSCTFAMTMQIERGSYGSVPLDGLAFVVLGYTPEEMGKGNWSVGLVIDERASAEQREAITAIASGSAGGPMAPLSSLIGKFLGVEQSPITFDRSGLHYAVKAGNF